MTQFIYHIAERKRWQAAREAEDYRVESLDTEGFIHCSLRRQVLAVADALYPGRADLVLLEIDPETVTHEIRYEGEADKFPHIYGPLNLDAVRRVADFLAGPDGLFAFPSELA